MAPLDGCAPCATDRSYKGTGMYASFSLLSNLPWPTFHSKRQKEEKNSVQAANKRRDQATVKVVERVEKKTRENNVTQR